MPPRHVVVDGSNLATEGRSTPSLAQLDQAVREFIAENPKDIVTVVVDASFGHRIDPSERASFEEAEAAGELVSPPAGAIGRGDAFLLRIAEKTGATVLSNDSFQEFHVEHAWLFDKGRLIGGKPVPGVGWIFMERSPVRGHKSREVVKEAKRRKKEELEWVDEAEPALPAPSKGRTRPRSVDLAIAQATEEVVEPKPAKTRRRRGSAPPSEPVNEPLAFINFVASHPLGSQVTGKVAEYSSHGAFIDVEGTRCYLPLSAMSDPPPRKAREAVLKGEERAFVVQAFDPSRRGIELALPGLARPAALPTPETLEAEMSLEVSARPGRGRRAASADQPGEQVAPSAAEGALVAGGEPAAPERPRRRALRAKASSGAPAPEPELKVPSKAQKDSEQASSSADEQSKERPKRTRATTRSKAAGDDGSASVSTLTSGPPDEPDVGPAAVASSAGASRAGAKRRVARTTAHSPGEPTPEVPVAARPQQKSRQSRAKQVAMDEPEPDPTAAPKASQTRSKRSAKVSLEGQVSTQDQATLATSSQNPLAGLPVRATARSKKQPEAQPKERVAAAKLEAGTNKASVGSKARSERSLRSKTTDPAVSEPPTAPASSAPKAKRAARGTRSGSAPV